MKLSKFIKEFYIVFPGMYLSQTEDSRATRLQNRRNQVNPNPYIYRNGVFEGTNYRATHFHPMSRQPFFDRLPTWKYDNAYPPDVKEEKWHLQDAIRLRYILSRTKSNEKIFDFLPPSLPFSLFTPRYLTCQRGNFAEYLKVTCAHI